MFRLMNLYIQNRISARLTECHFLTELCNIFAMQHERYIFVGTKYNVMRRKERNVEYP